MSWAETKKINSNLEIAINDLFLNFIAPGFKKYLYIDTVYEVPLTGVYTLRAFCANQGSYGKIIGKFKKGEKLSIHISSTAVTITSDLRPLEEFKITLAKDSEVIGNSGDFIKGIAIGGMGKGGTPSSITAYNTFDGGNATIKCNNGVASGGGGGGVSYRHNYGLSPEEVSQYDIHGGDGGTAYAYGTNTFALGGGGGSIEYQGNNANSYNYRQGQGGRAFVNDVEIEEYCSNNIFDALRSGKGENASCDTRFTTSYNDYVVTESSYGGNGGCGGGAIAGRHDGLYNHTYQVGGKGYFSDGSSSSSDSYKGGSSIGPDGYQRYNCPTNISGGKGYFAGGNFTSFRSSAKEGLQAGDGGFYGGNGNIDNVNTGGGGDGGNGIYGIGGNGAGAYSRNSTSYGNGGNGGYGKIKGGDAGGPGSYGTWGRGGDGLYGGYSGIETKKGLSINDMFYGERPDFSKTKKDSIVIIEMGNSQEDY